MPHFIGFYTINGPNGYIEGKEKEDVERYTIKMIRSWPNTIAQKPYKSFTKKKWIVQLKAKDVVRNSSSDNVVSTTESTATKA